MGAKRRFYYDTEFAEKPSTIEFISIGMVSHDGKRELYLVSNEFDEAACNDWVKENVLPKLPPREVRLSRKAIAAMVLAFLAPSKEDPVELCGYYADYDHVVLCWLFGSMVDLPPGMPKFTLEQLHHAIRDYAGRNRRFGAVDETNS